MSEDHVALYRRYRPQRFSQLIGQQPTAQALATAVKNSTVSHAYLFSGPRGCGKTSAARILAKAVNCPDQVDGEPCNVCDSCLEITAGVSMDVVEFDAATNSGVDAMREIVARAPLATPGIKKVIIIDESHMLSTAASNAFLKMLEEAPSHVIFILATTEPEKMMDTIASRCQKRYFTLVDVETMTAFVHKVVKHAQLSVSEDQVHAAIMDGRGSVRDTLSALDSVAGTDIVRPQFAVDLLIAMSQSDLQVVFTVVAQAIAAGERPRAIAEELLALLRECFFIQMGSTSLLSTPDWGTREQVARDLGPKKTVQAIEMLGEAVAAMQSQFDQRVNLEIALARFCKM